jgi:hypothetical protein
VDLMNLDPVSASIAMNTVSLSNCAFTVATAIALPLASTAPPIEAAMRCDAITGGQAGYPVVVSGWINTGDGSARLQASHHPGHVWSPVQAGDLAPLFTTPAFEGTVEVGVGGVALTAVGNATFTDSINLLGGDAVIDRGLQFRAELTQQTRTRDPSIDFPIAGSMSFPTTSLPSFSAEGSVTSSGNMSLRL